MNGEIAVTINVAQLLLLGGVIWGMAKMSASVDNLRSVTAELTVGLRAVGAALQDVASRVRVLEDREERERQDRRVGDRPR